MTPPPLTRRTFLALTAAIAAAGSHAMAQTQPASNTTAATRPIRFRKSLKYGMIQEGATMAERFRIAREAGFDGVELDAPSNWTPAEAIAAKERTGLDIPGVVDSAHWQKPLSHADPLIRAEGRAALERAVRDAHIIGARTVLLVPAVVNAETSYADAYARSQAEIRTVLPLAEDLGLTIAVENVWNHFLLSPLEAARYIDEFQSSAIRWYFDVGNVVNVGWPVDWIRTLGARIARLDIKDFSRTRRDKEGLWKGFDVEIGDGDVDWENVRAALVEIGYPDANDKTAEAWASAEVRGGDAKRLAEIARRMDRVLHGE